MEDKHLKKKYKLIMIGGSAGSLDAILNILPHLVDETMLSMVIILHRKNSNDSPLPSLLSVKTSWEVQEVEEKQPIMPHTIYIAPADYHLLIENDGTFSLDFSEKIHYSRPSIDVSFESGANVYGDSLVCILLSGANDDGAQGLKHAKAKGALVIVQDPETAEVPFMPQYAINSVEVDIIAHPVQIAALINEMSRNSL
jgi:two-component system chemotaxis response regulator CheB